MMKRSTFLTVSLFFVLFLSLLTSYFGARENSSSSGLDKSSTTDVIQSKDLRSENWQFYNEYYHELRDKNIPAKYSYGKRFFPLLSQVYPPKIYPEWLDAGCGNCETLRFLRKNGYKAYGTDVAESNLFKNCGDLVKKGVAVASTLSEIPFPDDKFDIVFSADVLEHIPHSEIPSVVRELVRISRTGVLFLSISQRLAKFDPDPPEAPRIHITLRPRSWWDDQFRKSECYPNYDILRRFQRKLPSPLPVEVQSKVEMAKRGREFWNELNETEPWVFPYICKK